MNFGAIVSQALTYRGTTSATEDSSVLSFLTQTVNDLQQQALTEVEAPWASREHKFETETAFTQGTVVFTNGNSLITEFTAAANGWTLALRGRRATIGTGAEVYDIVDYLPAAVGTSDGLRVDPPFYRGSATNATYAIYKADYDLPGDFRQMRSARLESQDDFLQYVDQWEFDHRVPRLMDRSPSQPRYFTISQRSRQPLLTNSGNVVLTAFSDRAIFSQLTFATDDRRYRGSTLRISGTTTVMNVRTMIGQTTGLLYEMWRGSTTVSQSFELIPQGQYRMSLWPLPSTTDVVHIRYYNLPATMVNTDDQPLIPEAHHDYLWKGAAYALMMWEANPEMAGVLQMLKGSFDDSRFRMLRALRPERDMIPQRGLYRGSWRHPRVLRFPNEFPNRHFRWRW